METDKNYAEMLEEAFSKIKPIKSGSERFEIPKLSGMAEGKKTIINDFRQVCSYLRRDCDHLAKFLLRELATSGHLKGDRLVLQRKIQKSARPNFKSATFSSDSCFCINRLLR